MAEGHGNFEWLPAGSVFFPLNAAVFARRDIKSQLILVMDHDAIRTVVDPPFVGIAGNIDAARADVAAAVLVMPERRGKLEHVDIAIFVHVFQ